MPQPAAFEGASGTARVLRKIVHVDMDAFYAAVEQRDDPSLRGRPVAVGGGGRGVVMTASYEARRFGVHSAMPTARALRLCPDLAIVRPRFEVYRAISRQIMRLFCAWTPLVEPLALDEAYLDVTLPLQGPLPAVEVARRIKAAIAETTGLTASAGVSFTKHLAKIASGLRKPDGLTVIRPERALALLARLPVEAFHGVGPATAARMRAAGIRTGADLQRRDRADLLARFGRAGLVYWQLARGLDDRRVEPDRPRRSVSVETTFEDDLREPRAMAAALAPLAAELAGRLRRSGFSGRTLTLKIRHADFRLETRSQTLSSPPQEEAALLALARGLLDRPHPPKDPVRLLGLAVSAAHDSLDPRQLRLGLATCGGPPAAADGATQG